jgi:hypothetical protein
MLCMRSIRAKNILSGIIRREDWPKPLRYIDGTAAIVAELITAPWILETFREAFQLPRSGVIDWGIRVSDSILASTVGRFVGISLGSGKSFLESGAETLNRAFTGHAGTTLCGGDSYQGKWLLAMLFAVLLLPAVVVVSFEPLLFAGHSPTIVDSASTPYKLCEKCGGMGTFGLNKPLLIGAMCPVCGGSGSESHKGRDNPISLLIRAIGIAILLFIGWLLFDLIFFVIRIATGV